MDLTVVSVPGKYGLSTLAYPASKGMAEVSAQGDEAETTEAMRIIDMEHIMEEDAVKCFDAPLGRRVRTAVPVFAPEGAESDKRLLPESCLQDDWTDNCARSEAFDSAHRTLTYPDNVQKWPKRLTEEDGKLYRNCKLLVRGSWVLELCGASQHHMMHPG